MKQKIIIILIVLVFTVLVGCKSTKINFEDYQNIEYNTEHESKDDWALVQLSSASMVSNGVFYYSSYVRDIKIEDIGTVRALNPDTGEEYSEDDILLGLTDIATFISLAQSVKVDIIHKAHICIYDKNGKLLWHRLIDYDEKIDYFTKEGIIYDDSKYSITINEDQLITKTPGS